MVITSIQTPNDLVYLNNQLLPIAHKKQLRSFDQCVKAIPPKPIIWAFTNVYHIQHNVELFPNPHP
jgi:hypothetical protein